METFPVILATTLLVAIVSGQDYALPDQGSIEPFQNPGEIIPGLTVSYLINAAGGIWQQERVIDSLAYTCTDVLPYLGSIIPDVDSAGLYWGPICDQVIEAADDLDAFDATGFCSNIIGSISGMIPRDNGTSGFRYRRQAGLPMGYPGSMDDDVDIIGTLINITRELYGIDINMIISDPSTINTICIDVKDNFLRPSFQDLISQFGTELLSALLAHERAIPVCQDWDGYLQTLGIDSTSPIYPIIQDSARIGSQAVGYDSREELCEAVLAVQGENGEARRSFATNLISSVFEIPTNAARCSMLASDLIDDVLEPVISIDSPDGEVEISDDVINTYTGFRGINPLCNAVEIAFTTVVDLPDPIPFQFFPNTTLTVEFIINAAGGVWLQDRTIDSMAFVCTDVLPDLESMVSVFSSYSPYYEPICRQVLEAASNLEAFDAERSCNDLTALFTDLGPMASGGRVRRQTEMPEEGYFDIVGILANITRDLYGIDVYDQSTVCPNIQQFLKPSLSDVTSSFTAELVSAVLPQAVMYVCQDFGKIINRTSPYYQIIHDAADIGSQILGYEDRDDICMAIQQALSAGGDARKDFGRNTFESIFNLFTDEDRCLMIGNDAIDDVVEPLIRIDYPGFEVSRSLIQRYTGFKGVREVCRALQTAFTMLSGTTVTLTITGETLNGEELMYTDNLANRESTDFKDLEMVFCGVVENHLTTELGSSLGRLNCTVISFSPGSVVAEMEIEVFATTQDIADSLAQDVADLSTSDSLTLSSDGDTLSTSSLSATVLGTDDNPEGRGMSTRAFTGIVVGVAVFALLL